MSDNNPNPNPNANANDKGKKRASYPMQPPPSERPGQMPPPSRPVRQSYPTPQGQPMANQQSKMNVPQQRTGHPSSSPLGKRQTFYSYAAREQRPSQPPVVPLQGRVSFNPQPDAPGKRPTHSPFATPNHPPPSPLPGQPVAHSPLAGQSGLNATWHPSNFQPGRRPTRDQSGAPPSQPSRGQPGSDAAAELRPFVKPQPGLNAMQQQTGQPRRPTFQPEPRRHEWPNPPVVSTRPGPEATQQQNADLAAPRPSLDQQWGERGRFVGGRQSAGSGEAMQLDAGERMEGVESEVQQPSAEAQQPQAADPPEQGKKSKATQQALHLATTTYSRPPEQEHNTAGGIMDDMERYNDGERLMDEWKRSQGKCEYLMCRLPEGRHEDHCIGAGKRQ